jgi:hypothetical protein
VITTNLIEYLKYVLHFSVEKIFDCTVVVISGGKPRVDFTLQTLKSVNEQVLKPNEKIFINHGHSKDTMKKIHASQELTVDWKIIDFPISTYDPSDAHTLFKFTGAVGLKEACSNFIFYLCDDDLIEKNFFAKMSKLIEDEPNTVVASGLAVGLDENKLVYPPNGSWCIRPKYEQGIEVFRKIYSGDELYHPNPGFSYVIRKDLVEETKSTIFGFGFPDITPMLQIIPRGIFAFDKDALMMRKNHFDQIHNQWDINNVKQNYYKRANKLLLNTNLRVLASIKYTSKKDARLLKKYYAHQLSHRSWLAIWSEIPEYSFSTKVFQKSNMIYKIVCVMYMLRTPIYSMRIVIKPGRLKKLWTTKLVKH